MKLFYDIKDKPKFPNLIVYAIQQLLAIMAATLVVPIIIGNGMQPTAALFGAGVGTLVYILFTKASSPVFLGSSFAFIGSMCAAFAGAALRAKKAGYDGVEIHAAHGYLLCQFYSPLSNKRQDKFSGSSLETRVRLHLEVIKAVRQAVGEDYPVAIRMGGCDYMEGGSSIADCVEACKLFEKAGVDIIDLSGGHCGFQPAGRDGVLFEDMAKAVKAAVSVPVILTGGIVDGAEAERLLEENACDMVGIGRALLKDAEWAKNQVYNENE